MLWVSRGESMAEGAMIVRASGTDMFDITHITSEVEGGGVRQGGRDRERVGSGAWSRHHFQSSGESNSPRSHVGSSSMANVSPAVVCWSVVCLVMFPHSNA